MTSRPVPAELSLPFRVSTGLQSLPRRAVDGSSYQRVVHGTRAPADLVMDHGQTIRAVRTRLGNGPVLIGASAAWALGAHLADPADPVHLMVDSGIPRQRLVVPHRGHVHPREVIRTSLGPATSPARTAIDIARGFGAVRPMTDRQRVAWVEALIHGTPLTAAKARRAVATATGLHGLGTARRVIATAVDGVESIKETELRLLVVSNGFPVPTVQYVVRTARDTFVARLDMAWPEHRVGLEYDGAQHRASARHSRDLSRHNKLRALDWDVLQVDARSLADPEDLLAQLAALLAR